MFKGGHSTLWASLLAQMVKNLPAMQQTWVPPLGQEDPLGLQIIIAHMQTDENLTTVHLKQ